MPEETRPAEATTHQPKPANENPTVSCAPKCQSQAGDVQPSWRVGDINPSDAKCQPRNDKSGDNRHEEADHREIARPVAVATPQSAERQDPPLPRGFAVRPVSPPPELPPPELPPPELPPPELPPPVLPPLLPLPEPLPPNELGMGADEPPEFARV